MIKLKYQKSQNIILESERVPAYMKVAKIFLLYCTVVHSRIHTSLALLISGG